MTTPCGKAPDIDEIQRLQSSHGHKIDLILENQERTASELKTAIDGLTQIIKSDIETRKDVEQLKKDRELLFEATRLNAGRVANIEIRNAKCDGLGIFERFPTIWDWYKEHQTAASNIDAMICALRKKVDKVHTWYIGEMGWRRFIPAAIAIFASCVTIYVGIQKVTTTHDHVQLKADPRGSVSQDLGITQ